MSRSLTIRVPRRAGLANAREWRSLAQTLVRDILGIPQFDLGIYIVRSPEMTRLNETHLRHRGATDVITFDYAAPAAALVKARNVPVFDAQAPSTNRKTPTPARSRRTGEGGPAARDRARAPEVSAATRSARPLLHGEIFICLDEAVVQARKFRVTVQSELARYLIHGVLHLQGFDDVTPSARRAMKREEDRMLRAVARRFALRKLAATPKLSA